MKRNAVETKRLARALSNGDHRVTSRKLERWSHEDLGPADPAGFSGLVRHYAEVDSISKSGRNGDLVARRLAARGFACERLRGAILREFGIPAEPSSVILPMPDLSTDEPGDAAAFAIEHLAFDMMIDISYLPPLMVKVVRALYRNAAERADQLGEPAPLIFHSFVVNALVHLMGGAYYNGEAIEAVLAMDRGSVSVEEMDVVNSKIRFSIPAFEDAYRDLPIDEIVVMAQRLTAWAPHLLRYLKITGTEQAEIEDLATVFAPAAIYCVNLLREAFDDFPDEDLPMAPSALELPAAVSE